MHAYMHACMHAYIHTYIHTYIHIYIHAYRPQHIHWPSAFFWGCRASSGHKFPYFTGPTYFKIVFIPLGTATGHHFNRLSLPSNPALRLHTSHLILCCVTSYSCHIVLICSLTKSRHDVATSDDVRSFCELRTSIFY